MTVPVLFPNLRGPSVTPAGGPAVTTRSRAADCGPEFDHLMHWVPDLTAAAAAYRAAGLRLRAGGVRPGSGVRHGAWWAGNGCYVEALEVTDPAQAAASTLYGTFTRHLAPAVSTTLSGGGGALNFAVLVEDVAEATTRMRAAGIAADWHTVRLPAGRASVPAFRIGWPTEGPRWAPFVMSYHPAVRLAQRAAGLRRRRCRVVPGVGQLVVEVPDPVAAAAWLRAALDLPPVRLTRPVVTLGWCAAAFVRGPADRITTVTLTDHAGTGRVDTVVAGLRYTTSRTGSAP